ncbi:MAG: hypothetical protein FJZ58_05990 [Chlamydiae bacterium]|nr:hypothetical protein [Chlamydiota bacterium]
MLSVFLHLFRKDFTIFLRDYKSKFYDTLSLFATNILVFGYLMPGEGLSADYGPFLLVAAIGSFGLIEIVGKLGLFLSDLEGEKSISQLLIMPVRSFGLFIYMALFWAISSMLLAVVLFPCGKLLLWKQWDLTLISYARLVLSFLAGNLFFGAFALWLASLIPSISSLNTIWLRYIAPLWMFGTYFFSWHTAYEAHPLVGLCLLINPIVYVIESMRSAALGPSAYLPYWLSILAMISFTIACMWHAIRRLKRRLDCI